MMEALCICNDPKELANHQQSYWPEGVYSLTVGKTYLVVGMSLFGKKLEFLVQGDWGGPYFAPAGFFKIFTATIPAGWHFRLEEGIHVSNEKLWISRKIATWGYYELVNDPEHAERLAECDPEALAIFARRLVEVESESAVAGPNDMKQPFLVMCDLGSGTFWGVLYARSIAEIKSRYPELVVLTRHPPEVTRDMYLNLVIDPYDIDEPPRGFLKALNDEYLRQKERISNEQN